MTTPTTTDFSDLSLADLIQVCREYEQQLTESETKLAETQTELTHAQSELAESQELIQQLQREQQVADEAAAGTICDLQESLEKEEEKNGELQAKLDSNTNGSTFAMDELMTQLNVLRSALHDSNAKIEELEACIDSEAENFANIIAKERTNCHCLLQEQQLELSQEFKKQDEQAQKRIAALIQERDTNIEKSQLQQRVAQARIDQLVETEISVQKLKQLHRTELDKLRQDHLSEIELLTRKHEKSQSDQLSTIKSQQETIDSWQRSQTETLNQLAGDHEATLAKLQLQLTNALATQQHFTNSSSSAASSIRVLSTEVQSLEKQILTMRNGETALRNELLKREEELQVLRSSPSSQQVAQLQRDLATLQQTHSELKSTMNDNIASVLSLAQDQSCRREKMLRDELDQLQSRYDAEHAELGRLKQESVDLVRKYHKQVRDLATAQTQLQQLRTTLRTYSQQCRTLRQLLDQARYEIEIMNATVQADVKQLSTITSQQIASTMQQLAAQSQKQLQNHYQLEQSRLIVQCNATNLELMTIKKKALSESSTEAAALSSPTKTPAKPSAPTSPKNDPTSVKELTQANQKLKAALQALLTKSDAQIAALQADLTKRDQLLSSMTVDLAKRDAHIEELNKEIKQRRDIFAILNTKYIQLKEQTSHDIKLLTNSEEKGGEGTANSFDSLTTPSSNNKTLPRTPATIPSTAAQPSSSPSHPPSQYQQRLTELEQHLNAAQFNHQSELTSLQTSFDKEKFAMREEFERRDSLSKKHQQELQTQVDQLLVQHQTTQHELQNVTSQYNLAQAQATALQTQLTTLTAVNQSLQQQLTTQQRKYDSQLHDSDTRIQTLTHSLDESSKQRLQLESKISDLTNTILQQEDQLRALRTSASSYQASEATFQHQLQSLSATRTTEQKESKLMFELLQKQYQSLLQQYEVLSNSECLIKQQYDDMKREFEAASTEVKELKQQLQVAETVKNDLIKQIQTEKSTLMQQHQLVQAETAQRLQTEKRDLINQFESTKNELTALKQHCAQLEVELKEATAGARMLEIEMGAFEQRRTELTKAHESIDHLKKEKVKLSEEVRHAKEEWSLEQESRSNLEQKLSSVRMELSTTNKQLSFIESELILYKQQAAHLTTQRQIELKSLTSQEQAHQLLNEQLQQELTALKMQLSKETNHNVELEKQVKEFSILRDQLTKETELRRDSERQLQDIRTKMGVAQRELESTVKDMGVKPPRSTNHHLSKSSSFASSYLLPSMASTSLIPPSTTIAAATPVRPITLMNGANMNGTMNGVSSSFLTPMITPSRTFNYTNTTMQPNSSPLLQSYEQPTNSSSNVLLTPVASPSPASATPSMTSYLTDWTPPVIGYGSNAPKTNPIRSTNPPTSTSASALTSDYDHRPTLDPSRRSAASIAASYANLIPPFKSPLTSCSHIISCTINDEVTALPTGSLSGRPLYQLDRLLTLTSHEDETINQRLYAWRSKSSHSTILGDWGSRDIIDSNSVRRK